MAQNTASKQLFDLLISRDFDPELLDSMGKPANDPTEAEVFSFDFRAESGKDYGTVVIMLSDDGELDVFCADNVGRAMEGQDKTDWFNFLEQLKNFAVRNFMSFGIKNLNRLRYSMQGQASIKEGLFESWTGTKTTSWNGKPTEARLMIKHKRALGENDARFRYVESLFIETAEGERYKLPFTKLSGGRAMVEHVRQGGRPYDIRGQHITSVVEEINVLSRFRRANHGQIFEGDTAQLVEQTNEYYESLQKRLKGMSNKRGYSSYFESWKPTEISEEEVVIEGLKHLFITQNLDTRIEQALPLLARIQQEGNAMKEANIFEAWANRLMEGTWQLPDTPEKQAKLVELLSDTLPVGADATDATEQLYDLVGDDILFDQLHELADQDANADCRQIIIDRLQELQGDPDVAEVINRLNINDSEMNPPESLPVPSVDTDEDPTAPTADKEKITRLAESSRIIEVNGRRVDIRSIEVDGVDTRDAPDFSDAYISYAQFDDGSALDDSELDRLNDENGDLVHELAYDSLHEGSEQPSFPEYDDSLSAILKNAGVAQQNNPAPDYEEEIAEADNEKLDEFLPALAAIGGRLAGGAIAGELGLGTAATNLAKSAGGAIAKNLLTPDDDVEEAIMVGPRTSIISPAEKMVNPNVEKDDAHDMNQAMVKAMDQHGAGGQNPWAAQSAGAKPVKPTSQDDVIDVTAKEVKEADIPDEWITGYGGTPSQNDVENYAAYTRQMKDHFGQDWKPNPTVAKPYDTAKLGTPQTAQSPVSVKEEDKVAESEIQLSRLKTLAGFLVR